MHNEFLNFIHQSKFHIYIRVCNGKLKMTFAIPKRFNIAVMLFMICITAYMMRLNFRINIKAMTNDNDDNEENETLPDYGPRYDWSEDDQELLLDAYFCGFMCTSIPAGMLAERYGGKAVVGYTSLLAAFFTALTPLAASLDMWAVFWLRFVIGCFGGVIYPSCHNLISKWAPPTERGKFVASLMGGTFATMIMFPLSGIIIEEMGWDWAFYIVALCCFLITLVWFLIVDNSPADHTTITLEERHLIQTSLGGSVSKRKGLPPFHEIMVCSPFWSLLLLHYGNIWGLFFLITGAPKFMDTVLDFDLASHGFLASLPHLARLVCAFGFGEIADNIRRKDSMSFTEIRTVFCISSHVMPGICLIVLAYFGREPYFCLAIMTLSLGFNGAATITNLANSQDLAPNYAGSLYGIINFFGSTAGIFTPLVVALYTRNNNTFDQWKGIFWIGAIWYIVPAILFGCLGSGEIQPWNDFDWE